MGYIQRLTYTSKKKDHNHSNVTEKLIFNVSNTISKRDPSSNASTTARLSQTSPIY